MKIAKWFRDVAVLWNYKEIDFIVNQQTKSVSWKSIPEGTFMILNKRIPRNFRILKFSRLTIIGNTGLCASLTQTL